MSTYEEQYRKHNVHVVIAQLEAFLGREVGTDLTQISIDNYERINQSVSYIKKRLDTASPLLASDSILSGINTHLTQAMSNLNNYSSNNNSSYLANATNQLDPAVISAGSLVTMDNNGSSISVEEVVSFKDIADKVIQDLRLNVQTVEKEKEDLVSNLEDLQSKLEALDTQTRTIDAQTSSKLEEVDTKYSSGEASRDSRFVEAEQERVRDFEQLIDKNTTEMNGLISELEEKKGEAERIVSLVGNIGLTGNYKGASATEKNAADKYRDIALVCFIVAALVVALSMLWNSITSPSPWQLLFRVGGAMVILLPGIYAARGSSRHRNVETRHNRTELELATINSYLFDLPDEQKNEIKGKLTSKFFGQFTTDVKSDPVVLPTDKLLDLLKDAIKEIKK